MTHGRNLKAGLAMATTPFTPEELRELRQLAAAWGKIVSQRAFGEAGPGLDVDFRRMEKVAHAAAQGITEGTLQTLLEQQAKQLGDEQPCPECGRIGRVRPPKRPLVAKGAEFEQVEPVAHGPDCRRDFSPPTDPPGPR